MMRNYLIIAWRNMVRRKIYTIINVLGLALGISACMVIYLIAHYELGFDTFHPDRERIYRIGTERQEEGSGVRYYGKTVPGAMRKAIAEEMSGFETVAGLYSFDAQISIPDGDRQVKKFDSRGEGGYITTQFADQAYFDIFKYVWLVGNPATALSEPFKVVLTESKALLYFGSLPLDKVIGREVVYNDSLRVSVSGVIKDWSGNTDFPLTDFISIGTIEHSFLKNEVRLDGWGMNNTTVFVKLANGIAPAQVNSQFEGLIKKRESLLVSPGNKLFIQLERLSDIHFTGDVNRGDGAEQHDDGDLFRKAHLPTLYGLMGGALFILIIAVVNFVNLSTAQSMRRAKEIGIRKVLGSMRASLITQFLIETLAHTVIAVCISVLMVRPILSAFQSFTPRGIKFNLFSPSTLLFILLVTVVTSLLAGFYPARVLSSYLPALSLKGISGQKENEKGFMRRGLIVFQFTISLIFIIGTLVIGNQIRFMRKELSFSSNMIVNLWVRDVKKVHVLAEKIKQLAGISKVALQGFPPVGMYRWVANDVRNKGKDEYVMGISIKVGNEDFIPLYEMKLIAGRNLQQRDSLREVVINRSYCKSLGFTRPDEALGELVYFNDLKPYPVIGVVEDFHEGSFHETIAPIVVAHIPENEDNIVIKLNAAGKQSKDVQAILSQVESLWKEVYPEKPFDYGFLDDDIAWLYQKEQRAATLMNAVMVITIFISCMGVFGLAMFSAQIRTMEIGIRKVLGATVANIAAMLSKEFVVLVLIATLISSPIAWYFMDQWLQDFAYRIDISWWVFVLAGLAALAIALVTVSFQAIKAARANPVESLRSE